MAQTEHRLEGHKVFVHRERDNIVLHAVTDTRPVTRMVFELDDGDGRDIINLLRSAIPSAIPEEEIPDDRHWTESLGAHRLDRTLAVAERLAAAYECTQPAGGLGPGTHCAACCYNTGIAATSMVEFETAQVLLAVPSLVAEIKRLREGTP